MTVSVFLQLSTVSRVQMFRLHELARPVTSEEGGGGGVVEGVHGVRVLILNIQVKKCSLLN